MTSSWGTSLAYDTRNHPKTPTKGVYFQIGSDLAGLGGDVQYVRVQGEGALLLPDHREDHVCRACHGGHIQGWGGEDVRLLDLFYKGGETIRGFDRAGLGPRDLNHWRCAWRLDLLVDDCGGALPAAVVPEDLGMSGAVFVDAGSLFGAGAVPRTANGCTRRRQDAGICLADDSSVRASAGASILWNSPLGPLRLDIAKAFIKQDFDEEQLIRFGASTKF